MTKEALKKNLSSMQVIKTLQVLLQGNYTMNELINILNKNEKEPIFNNSVVSKYINTCRYCGIEIPKIHNKYFVARLPFGLDLSLREADLLVELQTVVRKRMTNKNNKLFDSLMEKIDKFSNKRIARVEKDSYAFTAELFEKAIQDKRRVVLMYKNRTELNSIPLKITEAKGKTFFNVLYNGKERAIASERISGLVVTNEKFHHNYNDQSVIYELKGDLAKRYTLRENEQLMNSNSDKIVISNKGENKDILFARLLRYDSDCEILNPKSYREEFAGIINDALSNYGV